ncbi:MAG: hypothetical protein HC865_26180 [Cyanobacteria bacterium RU_5_0]|nr:hypothetical protein [Cyanobacteria bacterium RU_5_0]
MNDVGCYEHICHLSSQNTLPSARAKVCLEPANGPVERLPEPMLPRRSPLPVRSNRVVS